MAPTGAGALNAAWVVEAGVTPEEEEEGILKIYFLIRVFPVLELHETNLLRRPLVLALFRPRLEVL